MKKIVFTGDLGFSSKYFRGSYNRQELIDLDLIEYLCDADYTVVNMEGCVGNGEFSANKPIVHANPPECVDFMKRINCNIWALANNHIMDCGDKGLESTLNIAKENGIQVLGAGINIEQAARPIIIENDGANIGVIAVTCDETPQATDVRSGCVRWNDNEQVARMIAEVKKVCRWCVVVAHGGPEFSQLTTPSVRKLYKNYLNLGADIVVAHHPHVVENYEIIGDKIIFYSLGNFLFDTDYQRLQKYTEYGILLKLCFDENTFTWDFKAIKVDRKTQTIVSCEPPAIFTDVKSFQYIILWPLAMHNLYKNELVKFSYLYPKNKNRIKLFWFKFYLRNSKTTPRARGVIIGNILYYLFFWIFGNRLLRNYIKEGYIDQNCNINRKK